MTDAIVVRGVTKTFGPKVAVRDLDLTVAAGALTGFIGPNGAGKTTTIRMIMSILFPDQGDVSVLGHRSALDAKDRIGYLPEERGVYKKMKVLSFLRYIARLKGMASQGLDAGIKQWLERMDLGDVAGKKCEELSKGMQQKLQFIACVLHEPDLLILDEPFSGLDPVNMRLLRDLIVEQHERGATIIFSTHVMIQAEQLCERVVMIHEGNKVLDESMGAIRAKFDPRVVLLEPLDAAAPVEGLQALPGIRGVERSGETWRLSLTESSDPRTVIREIVNAVPPARIELHRPSLEDIFIQIVTTSSGGGVQEPESLRAALSSQGQSAGEVQA
ncbi:MAG: ATP-binding cassette domain-containing protein [Acidobacteria bacterium]|nr:ATP-binding cassette domain-containing protein [Acidobacteriota bacterium]